MIYITALMNKHKLKIFFFIFLLILTRVFYLQHKNYNKKLLNINQSINNINNSINNINNSINNINNSVHDSWLVASGILSNVDSLERRAEFLERINLPQNQTHKEGICNIIINDSIDPIEISEGYHCLAQIQLKNQDPASIYIAIRYESLALEAFYTEKYQKSLLSMITGANSPQILANFNEYLFLTTLADSDIPDISSRALYRMSLINSIGRASSLYEHNYNLLEAAHLKTKALSKINLPKKNTIDVIFSLNDNPVYINYAKTTITSILLNANLDSHYNIYIAMDERELISSENQIKLKSLQQLGSYKIEFITIPRNLMDDSLSNIFPPRTRVSLQKFLVEDILKDIESIIALDVDLIVLRDLKDLQHQESLKNYMFAASSEYSDLRHQCNFSYNYANTGVAVQNLELMRKTKNTNYLINKYKEVFNSKPPSCFIIRDQDALNLIYKDQIKFISRRWNYLPIYEYSTKFMPFIIHFAGIKPSKDIKTPEHLLYMKYEELANNFGEQEK